MPAAKQNLPFNRKAMEKHKKRFLRFFPDAFGDQKYLQWEHNYKWHSHKLWLELLDAESYADLLRQREFLEIARRALQVESSTKPPFLFSFEKMALRDALRDPRGARIFAEGLYGLLYTRSDLKTRFVEWIMAVSELPRKQSRVLSWPILTYYPFIAQPKKHMILKPTAMRTAAVELQYDFEYSSKPSFSTYASLLRFADTVKQEISEFKPRNYHDVQTFLWVIGSTEYEYLEEAP